MLNKGKAEVALVEKTPPQLHKRREMCTFVEIKQCDEI